MPVERIGRGHHRATAQPPLREWDIFIDHDVLDRALAALPLGPDPRRVVVIDRRVRKLHGKEYAAAFKRRGIIPRWYFVRGGERLKSLAQVKRLKKFIDRAKLDRRTQPIIAIGGGTVHDLVGTVAGWASRGIPWVCFGTTLVALIDAMLALKYGINFNKKKNALGGYKPPIAAIGEVRFLLTLDDRAIADGLAEMMKAALVADAELWDLIRLHHVAFHKTKMQTPKAPYAMELASLAMLYQLTDNPEETELTRNMDFAHDVGVGLEMLSALLRWLLPRFWRRRRRTHGQSVALNIAICAAVMAERDPATEPLFHETICVLTGLGLPVWDDSFARTDLLATWLADTTRTRSGLLRMWLIPEAGHGIAVHDVTAEEMTAAAVTRLKPLTKHSKRSRAA